VDPRHSLSLSAHSAQTREANERSSFASPLLRWTLHCSFGDALIEGGEEGSAGMSFFAQVAPAGRLPESTEIPRAPTRARLSRTLLTGPHTVPIHSPVGPDRGRADQV